MQYSYSLEHVARIHMLFFFLLNTHVDIHILYIYLSANEGRQNEQQIGLFWGSCVFNEPTQIARVQSLLKENCPKNNFETAIKSVFKSVALN